MRKIVGNETSGYTEGCAALYDRGGSILGGHIRKQKELIIFVMVFKEHDNIFVNSRTRYKLDVVEL